MAATVIPTVPRTDLARQLAADGAPPDDVERALADREPWLDAEQRAALWLVAWCTSERNAGEPSDNRAFDAFELHGRARPGRLDRRGRGDRLRGRPGSGAC